MFGGGEKLEGEGKKQSLVGTMGPTNINDGDDVFDDIGGWTVIEMPIFQARLFYPWRLSFAR